MALVEALPKLAGGSNGNPALEKMDKMLQEADITPANLGRLSEGFQEVRHHCRSDQRCIRSPGRYHGIYY